MRKINVSLCVVESLSEGLKWMLLKNVESRSFRTCFVDVLFEHDDKRYCMTGWLSEQQVTDVGQLQLNAFVEKLDLCLWKEWNFAVEAQEQLMWSEDGN